MGATSTALHRKLDQIAQLVAEARADLAALEIPDSNIAGQEHRPRTGWRWIRGETGASGNYVRDPQGTDRLPPGYDLTIHRHPGQPAPRDPYGDDLPAKAEA